MDARHRTVSEIMRTEIVTLAPDETLDLGQDIMRLGRLRHMPVVEGGRLVGLVSARDVFSSSLARVMDLDEPAMRERLRSVAASDVMAKQLVTVGPDAALADAARLLMKRQIGCLPVVDSEGALLGLVTATDLLQAAYLDG